MFHLLSNMYSGESVQMMDWLFCMGEKMAKEFAKIFYTSKEWRKCRSSYIAKRKAIDGGLCEKCRERLGYYVHHKILLTPDNIVDPMVALNHNLLEYVCKICHDHEDGHFLDRRKKKEKRFMFDSRGCPIPKS